MISLRFGGSFFQDAGPATKMPLSPKQVLVLGLSKEPDVEDLESRDRAAMTLEQEHPLCILDYPWYCPIAVTFVLPSSDRTGIAI